MTVKQKLVASKLIENGGNISKTMEQVGYSKATARNPQKLTNSKGWQELLDKFLPDDKLERQLLNRYYIQRPQTDLLALEPKPDARGRGHPSPDRADAAALAWVPYRWPQSVLPLGVTAPVQKTVKVMDDETLEMALEARKKKENADEILELSFSGSHRLSQYRNLNRRNKLYA